MSPCHGEDHRFDPGRGRLFGERVHKSVRDQDARDQCLFALFLELQRRGIDCTQEAISREIDAMVAKITKDNMFDYSIEYMIELLRERGFKIPLSEYQQRRRSVRRTLIGE